MYYPFVTYILKFEILNLEVHDGNVFVFTFNIKSIIIKIYNYIHGLNLMYTLEIFLSVFLTRVCVFKLNGYDICINYHYILCQIPSNKNSHNVSQKTSLVHVLIKNINKLDLKR